MGSPLLVPNSDVINFLLNGGRTLLNPGQNRDVAQNVRKIRRIPSCQRFSPRRNGREAMRGECKWVHLAVAMAIW
jgi:hypothetical protein